EELVERVFGLRCQVIPDPETGTPLVVPAARVRGAEKTSSIAGRA
ncbi:ABC transporter ATP-binding protein, partial [Streptomyces drozdowiczii]|nr:ABC transporter ATP-binding protein [Streptomyces drozdowiczii]